MIPIVNAEIKDTINLSSYTNTLSQTTSLTNSNILLNFDFTTPIEFESNKYNYIEGSVYGTILESTTISNINLSNVDWTTTCQSVSAYNDTYQQSYTITYADGSTATISGRETQIDNICTNLRTQGSIIGSSTNTIPNEITITMALKSGNTGGYRTECTLQNNNYKCTLPVGVTKVWGYVVRVHRKYNINSNVLVGLVSFNNLVITDTQTIINNNNNNTQQVINNQNNINNSITSNDVTGNNSSSSITSIGNTFSTQEDFLLNLLTIPYTLWTNILNVFSNTCAPLDVGTMFNYHLVFPCIELNDFLGGVYATIIDVIFTAIIYSAFIRRVIKYFRELLTLDEHALITGGVKLW